MKIHFYLVLTILLLSNFVFGQKPKVVVLGIEHSSQLINYNHQPAVLRAFINRVNPSAICIERSPEEYLRNDFYEFTFEQQEVVIPLAKQNQIPIYPIDWLPSSDDLKLAFGTDNLETPSFIRNPSGFWGFTVFSDSTSLDKSFYFADEFEYTKTNKEWYGTYPQKLQYDFARRLFLYRTFMQAKRIQAVLKNFNENNTVLVIVGALHKNEIEEIIQGNGFTLISPKSFGAFIETEINDNFIKKDAYKILNFNLLGMQANIGNPNMKLVKFAFDKIIEDENTERKLYKIKYNLLLNKIDSESAIKKYKRLIEDSQPQKNFNWTGVKDRSRIDSYFDPFGNLNLNQRIRLELAREYLNTSNKKLYNKTKNELINKFKGLKKNMLMSYIETYLEK
ncbi:hypothetical protein [Xanthomarina gelatinilytica]|uniref:hypothetical protein n=1 Tax=Xanthomarina gelatinilytica TaxID=1137281 RepID=UPI003AA95B37